LPEVDVGGWIANGQTNSTSLILLEFATTSPPSLYHHVFSTEST
jgi:hypothetical protein